MGQRHDHQELAHLYSMALTPSRISSKPDIFYGKELNATQRTEGEVLGDEACGDGGAHGFWKRGMTTIFDVQICDTDAKSYGNRTSKKVLKSAALREKSKYEEACLERHRDFTPMLYSVDGMADKHARAAEKKIADILTAKWTRQYSQIASFVRTGMCFSIVRSNTLLLRGDRAMNWRRRALDDGMAARAAMTSRFNKQALITLHQCNQQERFPSSFITHEWIFLQDLANYPVGYTSYIETLKINLTTTHTHIHTHTELELGS